MAARKASKKPRDYAKERAGRDAKYRAMTNPDTGKPYKSYNDYEYHRRNRKAIKEGFKKGYYSKKKIEKLIAETLKKLDQTGVDMEDLPEVGTPEWWKIFRDKITTPNYN